MDRLSPYAGLEPGTWRGLLARGAVFHATRTRLLPLSNLAGHVTAVRSVVDQLEMKIQQLCIEDLDDETTVAGVVKAWDSVLAQTLAVPVLDDDVRTLLTELQTLVSCARYNDPFLELFTGISGFAETLYGPAWRRPTLDVAHMLSHPRKAQTKDDPYVVTATTRWPPDEVEAAVELVVFCDQFGPAAYAALPMVLTHECVCHVPARQDRAKNDSTFAEGFLDWAAYFFFQQWAAKLDIGLAPAALRHADALHQVLASRTDTAEGRARQVGHEAADTLQVWMQLECDMPREESRVLVANLAVQLNQQDRPLRDKELFVSKLGLPMPPDVETAIYTWLADRDADNLMERLLAAETVDAP